MNLNSPRTRANLRALSRPFKVCVCVWRVVRACVVRGVLLCCCVLCCVVLCVCVWGGGGARGEGWLGGQHLASMYSVCLCLACVYRVCCVLCCG